MYYLFMLALSLRNALSFLFDAQIRLILNIFLSVSYANVTTRTLILIRILFLLFLFFIEGYK